MPACFVVDLNADAVKDFRVLEPVQTCGNGGGGGVILDGRDFREVGSAAMDFEVMPQRINGWHLLEVVARSGVRTAYPCMAYIGGAYQVISWDRCDAHAHLRNPAQMRAMGEWN